MYIRFVIFALLMLIFLKFLNGGIAMITQSRSREATNAEKGKKKIEKKMKLKFKKKKKEVKKKKKETETPLVKVLREEKEAAKLKSYLPSNSFGFNLEALFYVTKYTTAGLFLTLLFFIMPQKVVQLGKYVYFLPIVCVICALYVCFSKLLLRSSRAKGGKSWDLFFHVYRYSYPGFAVEYIFILIFFKVNAVLISVIVALHVLCGKLIQSHAAIISKEVFVASVRAIFYTFMHVVGIDIKNGCIERTCDLIEWGIARRERKNNSGRG